MQRINQQNSNEESRLAKLIFRVKATKSFYQARLYKTLGETEKCLRMCSISMWYHEQAQKNGYGGDTFLNDFNQLLLLAGKGNASILREAA
jgi:hypothetical protein